MALQLLKLHWKGSRWVILPLVLATSSVPLVTLQITAGYSPGFGPSPFLDAAAGVGLFYPILAALVGSIVALTAWNWDHQAGHVYALSLPISRARYAAMKFGAGLAILAVPSLFLLATAWGASTFLELPDGLRAHPVSLSLRFAAASAVVYGLFFALAAGRMRTAVVVLGSLGAVLFLALTGGGVLQSAVTYIPGLEAFSFSDAVFGLLSGEWGPMGVFNGSWTLIDV